VGQKNRHVRNIGQTSRQSDIAEKLAVGAEKQACQEYWANKQTKSDIADKQEGGAEKQACQGGESDKQECPGRHVREASQMSRNVRAGRTNKQACPGRQDEKAGM
jgi:hypothetical protein